jgi:hypothetical protein
LADEGEQVVFGGKRRLLMGAFHENKIRERNSLILGYMGANDWLCQSWVGKSS